MTYDISFYNKYWCITKICVGRNAPGGKKYSVKNEPWKKTPIKKTLREKCTRRENLQILENVALNIDRSTKMKLKED